MQAVAAEFSGCAEKFYCFLEREEFKTRCFDSFICKTCPAPYPFAAWQCTRLESARIWCWAF